MAKELWGYAFGLPREARIQHLNLPAPPAIADFVGVGAASSIQSVPYNTETAIKYLLANYDPFFFWSAGAPTRFTVPAGKSGKYAWFASGIRLTAVADSSSSIGQYLNSIADSPANIERSNAIAGTSGDQLFDFASVDLAVADYVEEIVHYGTSKTDPHIATLWNGGAEMVQMRSLSPDGFISDKYSGSIIAAAALTSDTWAVLAASGTLGASVWTVGTPIMQAYGQAIAPVTGVYRLSATLSKANIEPAGADINNYDTGFRWLINSTRIIANKTRRGWPRTSIAPFGPIADFISDYTLIYLTAGDTIDFGAIETNAAPSPLYDLNFVSLEVTLISTLDTAGMLKCNGQNINSNSPPIVTAINTWTNDSTGTKFTSGATGIVATQAGIAEFFVNGAFQANATGERFIQLRKNGSSVRQVRETTTNGATQEWGGSLGFVDFNVQMGDNYTVCVRQNSGGILSFSGRFGGNFLTV